MNPLNKIATFFKDVGLEMKKVNWPTKKDTLINTVTVIAISVVAAIFLGGLDYVLINHIFPWIISR
jgi:preprotein translocase subunit SecE